MTRTKEDLADSFGGRHIMQYLKRLGVPSLPPRTVPFDPGYDPQTVVSHLSQSGHLMAALKLSMTCWQIADPRATELKISAAKEHGIRRPLALRRWSRRLRRRWVGAVRAHGAC